LLETGNMTQGIYPRTEWHKEICRKNAKKGSRITKFNLPQYKNGIEGNKNPRWKGGKSDGYISKKAKELSIHSKCENCSSKKNIDRHHKDRNKFNNVPENIQVLCRSCHKFLHNKDILPSKSFGSG